MRGLAARVATAVVAVLATGGLAGCTGDPEVEGTPAPVPPVTSVAPTAPPAAAGTPGADVITDERRERGAARLTVVSGASSVTVRAADIGDDFFRAWTTDTSGSAPAITVAGDTVRVELRGTGDGSGPTDLVIEVSPVVAWDLRLDGGAERETVDLTGGRLAALAVPAGVSRLELTLPPPRGDTPVRLAGGAATVDVRLPAGAAARATLTGGAGSVTFDGEERGGVAGGTAFATDGWDAAGDRYDIDLAGVSSLVLARG